jgi:Fe2+ or Zn2+ uptake regulation protein
LTSRCQAPIVLDISSHQIPNLTVINHVDIVRDSQGQVTAFCYNGAGAACADLRHEDGDNYICTWCGEVLPLPTLSR